MKSARDVNYTLAAHHWAQASRRREISAQLLAFYADNNQPAPPRAEVILLPVRKIEHVVMETLDTAPCGSVPFLLD